MRKMRRHADVQVLPTELQTLVHGRDDGDANAGPKQLLPGHGVPCLEQDGIHDIGMEVHG